MGGSLRGGWKIFISLARRRFPLEKRLNVVVYICRLSACLTAIINRKSWTCALLGMATRGLGARQNAIRGLNARQNATVLYTCCSKESAP
jgi:hypothetical protein